MNGKIEIITGVFKKDDGSIVGSAILKADEKTKRVDVNLPKTDRISAYLILVNTILRDHIKRKDVPIKLSVPVREFIDVMNDRLRPGLDALPYLITLQKTLKGFKSVNFAFEETHQKISRIARPIPADEQAKEEPKKVEPSREDKEGPQKTDEKVKKALVDAFIAGVSCAFEYSGDKEVIEKYRGILEDIYRTLH